MPRPRPPSQKETAFALDQARRIERARAKLPSLADIRKELGSAADGITVDSEGQCHGQVRGHAAVRRLMEMQNDWREAEIERSAALNASISSVNLGVDAVTGRPVTAPEHRAEQRVRKGRLRPRIGGRPSFVWRDGKYYDRAGNQVPEPPTHPSWPWAKAAS